jgi:class 3 adenylate cyclase
LFRAIQTRLEFKILLLLIAVLLAGFGAYAIISIDSESRAMLRQEQEKLRVSSNWLMAGIRNVMLTGKSPVASEFVNDCRQNFERANVTIYDRFGREVFLREGEGIRTNIHNRLVDEVLAKKVTSSTMIQDGKSEIYTRYEPLKNTQECWRCHDRNEPIRGVLEVALKPGAFPAALERDALRQIAGSMGNIIATAFRTIMLGGNGEQMDTLVSAVREIPGVTLAQVYDRSGDLHFGPDANEIKADLLTRFLEMRPIENHFEETGNRLRLFVPLENQDRCQVCHGGKYPMRGVLVLDFSVEILRNFLRDPEKKLAVALQATTFEGFKSIMLVGRANSMRFFMDELRKEPALQTVRVYDKRGDERFLNPPARTLKNLKNIVDSLKTLEYVGEVNGEEAFVRVVPLLNEDRCHSCHGSAHKVRGVVELSTPMNEINDQLRANKVRSAGIGALTMVLVWLVIRFFMKSVVVKPVVWIGEVAARVGQGDFSAQADVRSLDEIGNLAKRINQMVHELREKFHLQKFVSRQTVDAVRRSTIEGVKLGGERKLATVFFSDIRGFTSISEKVEPERVVSMLNTCLAHQAAIVGQFNGDIDKYVGDEVVAVFEGPDMVADAVRAALMIQRTIRELFPADDKDIIAVGVGINTGEMIMGAMGSEERMDYTVIGDNVNLGARLCNAAKSGQILLSQVSAEYISKNAEFELKKLEPISVKGKEQPIVVYEVVLSSRSS